MKMRAILDEANIEGNSVKVETLTKFYFATTNPYIGVYLLEDGVEASQKISNSPKYVPLNYYLLIYNT